MTRKEAERISHKLEKLLNLEVASVREWLALVEDELSLLLPDRPKVIKAFGEIRDDAEKQLKALRSDFDDDDLLRISNNVRPRIQYLLNGFRKMIDSEPYGPDDLKEEVERIIHKGYFESIYFKAIVGGLALVLVLVTGIEGYKLNEQVKAMERLVQDARKQVEDGRVDIAKNSAEIKDRQAQVALALLEGSEEMSKLRAGAIQQITQEQDAFRSRIEQQVGTATMEITKSASAGNQTVRDAQQNAVKDISEHAAESNKEIDKALQLGKALVASKLSATLTAMDKMDKPWIPRVVWAMSKTWMLAPLAFVVAVLACINSFALQSGIRRWIKYAIVGTVGLLLIFNLIFVVNYR